MEDRAILQTLRLRETACSGAVIGAEEARFVPTSCHLRAAVSIRADITGRTAVLVGQIKIDSLAVRGATRAAGARRRADGILAASCEEKARAREKGQCQ